MPIYSAIYNGPPNGYTKTYTKKKYIAIHNTSNDATAENEASYAKNRTDGVSSHYYVDNNSIIQSLNTDYKAWHAGSSEGNTYAISYEIVGTNSKSRDWWIANVDWDKLAKQIATDMKQFGIANQHLSVSEMKAGSKTGIVTHNDMRLAWGGTTHTDPGSNFPMDYLLKKVDQYLNPEEDIVASLDELRQVIREEVLQKKFNDYARPDPNKEQLISVSHAIFSARSDSLDANRKLATVLANQQILLGKDFVDEQAVVDGVLKGLGEKDVNTVASVLKSVYNQEQLDALKAAL